MRSAAGNNSIWPNTAAPLAKILQPNGYSTAQFSGKVNWVEIAVGMDDHNHLISPEERLNLALAFH